MLARAEAVAAALSLQTSATVDPADNPTLSILMQQAEDALEKNNFIVAKALFADLHEKMPNDLQSPASDRDGSTRRGVQTPRGTQCKRID